MLAQFTLWTLPQADAGHHSWLSLLEKHTAGWMGEPGARMTSRHCPSGLQNRYRKVEPSSLVYGGRSQIWSPLRHGEPHRISGQHGWCLARACHLYLKAPLGDSKGLRTQGSQGTRLLLCLLLHICLNQSQSFLVPGQVEGFPNERGCPMRGWVEL